MKQLNFDNKTEQSLKDKQFKFVMPFTNLAWVLRYQQKGSSQQSIDITNTNVSANDEEAVG